MISCFNYSSQISIEGFISFGDEVPSPASVLQTATSGHQVIAPLVGLIPGTDTSEQNRFQYRNTSDSSTLDKVVDVITKRNPNLTQFQPVYALVTTWFLYDSDQNLVRTFTQSN